MFIGTKEQREKMRKIALEKGYGKWMVGKKVSKESNIKRSNSLIGHSTSIKTRNKIRNAQTGIPRPWQISEKHPLWKGNSVGYDALHRWITRHLGKPQECVYCGKKRIEGWIDWASVSHKAKRDLNDFISLCRSCHRNYDNKKVTLVEA